MKEIKVGDKVLVSYGEFRFKGIVTSIDDGIIRGDITPTLKYFRAPKSIVFPIKEKDDERD